MTDTGQTTRTALPQRAQVVIIGGGVIGCSRDSRMNSGVRSCRRPRAR